MTKNPGVRSVLLLLAIAFLTLPAQAQMSGPDPKLKELASLVHDYQCSSMVTAASGVPAHAAVGSVKSKWILGGRWLEFQYAERKTKENQWPMSGQGAFGYDADGKQFLMSSIDSTGGWYTQTASGWEGNTITFVGTGHAPGMSSKVRDVFTTKGDKQLLHTLDVEMQGKWVNITTDDCRR